MRRDFLTLLFLLLLFCGSCQMVREEYEIVESVVIEHYQKDLSFEDKRFFIKVSINMPNGEEELAVLRSSIPLKVDEGDCIYITVLVKRDITTGRIISQRIIN